MNNIIEQMLKQYDTQTVNDKKNIVKEVVQEIVLSGLSRAGFFKDAAFYGGTALRIFYGLDRFSEDLDFSLKASDPEYDFSSCFPILEKEIRSYGLNFKVETREKAVDSNVKSAFVKGNTREHMLLFYSDEQVTHPVAFNEVIKIKFEVDTKPPDYAQFEHKYRLLPIPYEIMLYDMPSLFAGKIHAVVNRQWKNRVKGRDLYDYVFYLSKNTGVNLKHLTARLVDSDYITGDKEVTINDVKDMLCTRFGSIDFNLAKQDVLPFIKNPATLDVWSADFFCSITAALKEA
jgi:predicted nucleotidyltransferase component of viral defense system